jgi:hypothetical protein|tara:strand:+ start:416 stop:625 length:210 start_codon:yes stop_codon:yes gene_type:complete
MPPLFLLTKLQIMENYIPKNSINTPLKKNEKLERLKKENERVRQNNMDLKLQIIEAKQKINQINKLINK